MKTRVGDVAQALRPAAPRLIRALGGRAVSPRRDPGRYYASVVEIARSCVFAYVTRVIWGLVLLPGVLQAQAVHPPTSNPGGVLGQLAVAAFGGSGQNSIQVLAADPNGNIYLSGTTTSPDLPVKNAYQPNFAEARILKTSDLGATWTRVTGPPDSTAAVFPDPVAPQTLFASGATGIFKSTDGAATWRLVYSFPQSFVQGGGAMAIDPGNHSRLVALVPFSGALIRSVDGGETWSPGSVSCPISNCGGKLIADPGGSGELLSLTQTLNLSRDFGSTFHDIEPPGPGGVSAAAFDPSHPGWIYAGTSAGVLGAFYLSTDYGATWTARPSPPTTFSAMTTVAVDPQTPSTILAYTLDGLYKSIDGASSWVQVRGFGSSFEPNEQDPFVLLSHQCATGGGMAAIGSGGGVGSFQVAFSQDSGTTFSAPQLTGVTSLAAGPSCAVYVMRQGSSDAFLSKLAPDGTAIWTTYFGGGDQDVPAGLVLDPQGNVYVTGNTFSPDFPATLPRIGPLGTGAVFTARFTPDGRLDYSVLIGGEAVNSAVAIAADAAGNAYVIGTTDSQSFPVTAGTLVTKVDPQSYTGFLAKFSITGSLTYATYLGPSYMYARAILANADGTVILAGAGPGPQSPPGTINTEFVMELNASGSQVVSSTTIQVANPNGIGPAALGADSQGNLIVAGSTFPTGSIGCPEDVHSAASESNVFVAKLAAADWSTVYNTPIQAPCGVHLGSMAVDGFGSVILGLSAGRGLPLLRPLLGGNTCSFNSSAIAMLSPDGSTLQSATYLDNCGAPAISLAPDGSIYAGVSPRNPRSPAGVLRVPAVAAFAPLFSLDRVANAFSDNTSAVAFGGLYSLAGTGFTFAAMDLGLSPSQDLPAQLAGVQVKFDGVPGAILQTAPGRVIVAAPAPPEGRGQKGRPRSFTAVQLFSNGVASNVVLMPVASALPGLLTVDYPSPPHASFGVSAVARNADGTTNDASHPAAAGSSITLFATGMGAAKPQLVPGSVAKSSASMPVTNVYSSLETYGPGLSSPPTLPVSTVPGEVSAVFQVVVALPSSAQNLGTAVANGVRSVPVALNFYLSPSSNIPPASNYVAVYVK